MDLAPLPTDARIFEPPRPKTSALARESIWDGRLDLTEEDAWHLRATEFDRFFANLVEVGTSSEMIERMRVVRRKIYNRESARASRAKVRAEFERLRARVDALEAENAILRHLMRAL